MEGLLLWRAGDYLLQLEWVETDGREERVGGSTGPANHPDPVCYLQIPSWRDSDPTNLGRLKAEGPTSCNCLPGTGVVPGTGKSEQSLPDAFTL